MSRMIGKKRRQYDPVILEEAAQKVRSDAISLNRAAREYGIPKSTLHDKVHNKYASTRIGPKRALSDAEEERIVNWAIHMSRIGYGRTRKELVSTVKKILDDDGRVTPFTDNRPGKDWVNAFFKRHPSLTLRTTLQLGKERAIISPEKINRWFSDFITYIEDEVKDPDILKDPSRLYNADESGFALCVTSGKVIGCKGAPVVYNYGNSSKQQLTVMAAASASGHFIPPMIVYPGQRFSYNPLEGFEEATMGRSDTGWMDSELFCEWLQTVFIPGINTRHVKKPVVLLLDGHSTHVSLEASNICLENGVELYCLLEHASHIMQPLDLRLFASLKRTWKQAVREFQTDNIGELITKRTFARVFRTAWERSTTIDVAIKGFMEAGLFPISPEMVSKSVKLEPSTVFGKTENVPVPSVQSSQFSLAPVPPSENTMDPLTSTQQLPVAHSSSQEPEDMLCPAKTHDTLPAASIQSLTASSHSPMIPVTSKLLAVPLCPARAEEGPSVSCQPPEQSLASVHLSIGQTSSEQLSGPSVLLQSEVTNTRLTSSPSTPGRSSPIVQSAGISPFSKHLKYPTISAQGSNKRKIPAMPKAITGTAYRKLLQDKKDKKEKEEQEKTKRKEERVRKSIEKQNLLKLKKIKQMEKKKQREAKLEKKREKQQKLLREILQSDSDDAQQVAAGECYQCERPYENFIQCDNCIRRFHFTCVENQIIGELPFECKYC